MLGGGVEQLQNPLVVGVKTDARYAAHLAPMLLMNKVTLVAIPSVDQEAVRDLVLARKALRGAPSTATARRLGRGV